MHKASQGDRDTGASPDPWQNVPTDLLDYSLPEECIAQSPLLERDASRLLHLPPDGLPLQDRAFRELPELLLPGDLLVLNATRVRAARLIATSETGGRLEVLVVRSLSQGRYSCLVRPGRRAHRGRTLLIGEDLSATIEGPSDGHPGAHILRFQSHNGSTDEAIERLGAVPLPPYIHEELQDDSRYQTVYAAGDPESAAAPTAGLHFTQDVFAALRQRGVETATVHLEVGLGTFAPIRAARIRDHVMHEERYSISPAAAEAVARARARSGRVIAVGTTSVRALETCATADRMVNSGSGRTGLYLRPGAPFRVVDGLLTNFHAPRSSLLVLLAAFIGMDRWREAYEHALLNGYRFLSFGDCMLCWRSDDHR